jgi:hypothetical protein
MEFWRCMMSAVMREPCSNPGRVSLSFGDVIDVRKSTVACLSGHWKPRRSK